MNADLEETLGTLGPDYRRLVDRLVGAFPEEHPRAFPWRRAGVLLAAASLLAVLGFGIVLRPSPVRGVPALYRLAYDATEEAHDELLRTQRADGSWENDFLTRQNAAALRHVADASVAYRRALRYLRSKGLEPFSDDELRRSRRRLRHG